MSRQRLGRGALSVGACKGKRNKGKPERQGSSANVHVCTKCDMPQRLDRCKRQLNAKLIIQSGTQYLTLNAFGSNVVDIAEQEDVTAEALLSAPPFDLTYDNNVITSIDLPGMKRHFPHPYLNLYISQPPYESNIYWPLVLFIDFLICYIAYTNHAMNFSK